MAAQYGVATFYTIGTPLPQSLNVQIYCDDTAGNLVLWDVGGGDAAKGANEFRPPQPVILSDIVLAAATGQTKTTINRGGSKIGTLLNAAHLASVTNRPKLSMAFGPNAAISGNQVA